MMTVAIDAKKKARREAMEHEASEFRAAVARRQREQLRRKEALFQERYRKILDEESTFVASVRDFLTVQDRADYAKREKLYLEWCERVYQPIQRQIGSMLEGLSVSQIERRRREMFDEFLHQTNTKDGLFRDIIIEHEYNPLRGREHTLRFDNPDDMADPTRQAVVKKLAEERAGSTGKLRAPAPRQRDVFDVRQWDRPEATPYGRYNKMMERSAGNAKLAQSGTLRSTLVMDHYDFPVGKEAIMKEMPKGKRVWPDWTPGQPL
jgi:hypothetical protein